jgi:hypothetical protein
VSRTLLEALINSAADSDVELALPVFPIGLTPIPTFGDVTFWHNSRPPEFEPSEIAKRKEEHSKKLVKYVEDSTKDVEHYKIRFEAIKVELERAKKEYPSKWAIKEGYLRWKA